MTCAKYNRFLRIEQGFGNQAIKGYSRVDFYTGCHRDYQA